jgi:dTDP-4-dehydrorhamnose 3,5-epimerase
MNELIIEGIKLEKLNQFIDDRGAVLHMLRSDSPYFTSFGECYFSEVFSGKVKAWKRHKKQTQNISVPIGRVKLVIYDDRENSSTNGNVFVIELGRPDSYNRITIPPNLWYGFSCISKSNSLLVNCPDIPYSSIECEILDLENQIIPYKWELKM